MATSEQRRAAVVARIKAEGPRPVFRSGVDIDAAHFGPFAIVSPPLGRDTQGLPAAATLPASSSAE